MGQKRTCNEIFYTEIYARRGYLSSCGGSDVGMSVTYSCGTAVGDVFKVVVKQIKVLALARPTRWKPAKLTAQLRTWVFCLLQIETSVQQ